MPANSKASQLLNGVENFMNGVSNAARDVLVNPAVDLGALAAKGVNVGLDKLTGQNLAKEANKKIDQGAAVLKGEAKNSLQRQPVDPASTAYAVGEGITKGVDQAAGALGLIEAAKFLPKAAQKGWKAILNKVNKANTPAKQKAVVNEARDYVTKHIEINDNLSKRMYNQSAEVPAYQQRAYAAENPGMSKYKTKAAEVNFATTKGGDTSTPLWPMTSYENSLKQKLTPERASQLGVPYRKWASANTAKKSTGKALTTQRAAADKAAQALDYTDYKAAQKVADRSNGLFKDGKQLIKEEAAWRNSAEGKAFIAQQDAVAKKAGFDGTKDAQKMADDINKLYGTKYSVDDIINIKNTKPNVDEYYEILARQNGFDSYTQAAKEFEKEVVNGGNPYLRSMTEEDFIKLKGMPGNATIQDAISAGIDIPYYTKSRMISL